MSRYVVDAAASRIRIEAQTTLHPVVVETSEMRGHLDLEVGDDGSVTVPEGGAWVLEVPGRALRSGNAMIDRETSRRVDWRRFPYVRGELVEREPNGNGPPGRVAIVGEVSFHGEKHRLSGHVQIEPAEGAALAVRGAAVLDVRDFGLQPPRMLMLKVQPELTVSIDLRVVAG